MYVGLQSVRDEPPGEYLFVVGCLMALTGVALWAFLRHVLP